MARTSPSDKAKKRAQAKQNITGINPTMDPEMAETLRGEGERAVARQRAGEAITGGPKRKKRSFGSRVKRKIQRTLGLPEDE